MSGTITEFLVDEDSTVEVGQDLLRMEPGEGSGDSAPGPEASSPSGAAKSEPKDKEEGKREEAAPAAGKEKNAGEDVKKEQDEKAPSYAAKDAPAPKSDEKPAPKKESKPAPKKEESAAPKTPGSRNETRVKMNRMRQTIASRLKQSQNTAASLTTFQEVDMSSAMEFRKLYKDGVLKTEGVKLGFMSFFARASCLALKEIPSANASIEGDHIVYRDYVDLSVAVATPKGLVTPIVRNAETMGLVDIERAIAELGKKARDGKLSEYCPKTAILGCRLIISLYVPVADALSRLGGHVWWNLYYQ
jgi:2-oxoglutarate dehydrogenase E2 component (dihydrolipoamide succinyltransferase)